MVWISTSKKRHHQTPNTPPPTLKYCLRDLKLFLHHTQEQSLEKKTHKKTFATCKNDRGCAFVHEISVFANKFYKILLLRLSKKEMKDLCSGWFSFLRTNFKLTI